MAVSADLASSVHEPLDLALGEIAALDCEVFSVWCAAIGHLICHGKSLSCKYDWKDNSLFVHSEDSYVADIRLFASNISAGVLALFIPRHPSRAMRCP